MSVHDLYTAENMAGEDYNISEGELSFTPSELRVQVRPGGVQEGSFVVAAPAGIAVVGYVFPGSLHLSCSPQRFVESPARISWRFDAASLREGDSDDGYLRILSNCGEYKLPFHAEITQTQLAGGEILEIKSRNTAAARFLALADGDWHSAVRLFYRREFAQSLRTEEERILYRGLSQDPGNEQNVEEFLIATCGKDPVEYFAEEKEVRAELLGARGSRQMEPREYSLRIRRRGWGFVRLDVFLSGGFLRPASARVGEEDFIGDLCEFPYAVDPSRLHAGRNFGSITLKSPWQTIRIPVEIFCRRNLDSRRSKEREAWRIRVEMMRAYERLHIHWSKQVQSEKSEEEHFDTDEWIRLANEYVRRLSYLERDTTLPRLYKVQLLLMQNRVHQAILELESVRRKLAGVDPDEVLEMGYAPYRGESELAYCYRQFLTALAYNDAEGITPRVTRILRDRYRRGSAWQIAWLLLQLSPEYATGTVQRWNFLKKQFLNGCRSPLIYLEAWDMIAADSSFLRLQEDRRTGRYGGDAFERQVLYYALRKGLLDTGTLETVLELTERRRGFSPALFRILSESYEQDRLRPLRERIVQGICTMLIRGNITDSAYFVWFSRAVERGIDVTRLPEYFLQSMPEDYSGPIPDSVIQSTYRGGFLTSDSRSYFYRYLYEHRSQYPAVYERYREDIRQFLRAQISEQRMSQNLAALYTACLRDAAIRPDNAGNLVKFSYLSLVRTTHLNMRRVVILYAQSSRERTYPMEEGNCMLPVYGEDNRIFLEDDHRCRYTASVPYTCDRMMQPIETGAQISPGELEDLPFVVEVSGIMEKDFRVRAENLQYCESMVRSAGLSPKYRLRLKLYLLRYYEDTGAISKLEQMLQTLEPRDLDREDRCAVLGCMHRCGRDEMAAQWMLRCGAEGVPGDLIVEICLGVQDAALPARAGDLAWEAFLQGERGHALLAFLMTQFEGLSSELSQIREAAAGGSSSEDADDRIMRQGLFTGEIPEESCILRQYRRGGPHRVLAEAALAQYCHYAFADWMDMAPESMQLISTMDRSAENPPMICKLAFLKTLSARPAFSCEQRTGATQDEWMTAQRFLSALLRDEIFFPFFRQFADLLEKGEERFLCAHETMIEYHSPAGVHHTRGHVVIHCALERAGRQEPFTAREMREMYRGFYVSALFLFYGEQVHYFITDDPEEKNIVESGTMGQDVRVSPTEDDKFGRIDALSRSVARREREETLQLLRAYRRQEYLVRTLFGDGED